MTLSDFAALAERDPFHATVITNRLRRLARIDYGLFLKTPYWAMVRRAIRQRDGGCTECGSLEKLQVHHENYDILGREWEKPSQLVTLCDLCHAERHNKGLMSMPVLLTRYFDEMLDRLTGGAA